jgi:hypothetical protein
MKIALRILGMTWTMEDVPTTDCELHRENWGCTRRTDCRIVIDQSLPEERKQQIRLHELIHTADCESGESVDELTEAQVGRLSRALWAILRDNPAVLPALGLGGAS